MTLKFPSLERYDISKKKMLIKKNFKSPQKIIMQSIKSDNNDKKMAGYYGTLNKGLSRKYFINVKIRRLEKNLFRQITFRYTQSN